jgi:uncharacterized protein (DUF736 family)
MNRPEVREKLRAAWNRPEVREKLRAAWNRPEVREKWRAAQKAAMNRPEVREKLRAAMNRPEVREKLRAAWNRPEVREKRCAGIARARAEGRCPGRPNGFQEDNVLCAACRSGNHLACDGGECRCVCALELDEKLPRKWRAA